MASTRLIPAGTENDGLGETWKPIEEAPRVAGAPSSAPSVGPQSSSPYFAASIPQQMQLPTDIVKTEYPGGLGGYRVMPPGPAGIPALNSAITSTATPIAEQAAAAAVGGVSIKLGMPDIFVVAGSPADATGDFEVTLAPESPNTFFAGPIQSAGVAPEIDAQIGSSGTSATAVSLGPLTPRADADWAFFVLSDYPAETITPGADWSAPFLSGGNGAVYAQLCGSAAVTGNATLSSATNWAGVMALFATNGSAPTIIQHNEAFRSAMPTAAISPTTSLTAGNAVLVYGICDSGNPLSAPIGAAIADTQGNTWYLVGIQTSANYAGGNSATAFLFFCPACVGGADTATVTVSGVISGNALAVQIGIVELTPFAAFSELPVFRLIGNSDLANAIFGPSGPSHAPGAVPDPGATAGSTRFLREDATWAAPSTGVFPDNTPAITHEWLNSYNSTTGAFGQSQPNYSDLAGSPPSAFNQSMLVDGVDMSDDYWISVDDGAYDQALPLTVM